MSTLFDIDIDKIDTVEDARNIIVEMVNIIESFYKEKIEQKQTEQDLRDEINRLKGEQGKPVVKANKESPKNISSKKETKETKHWHKESKKGKIKIDKTVSCSIDKSILPADAVFKGYERIVSQHIIFKRENTEYLVAIYYSPSEKKTYKSTLPKEYNGYFSNGLKSFSNLTHRQLDVPRNKLLSLLRSMGIEMSDGSLNNILQENAAMWIKEKDDIRLAGLSDKSVQTDITTARVNGKNHYTHIICNENFAVYTTLPGKSRQDVIMAFMGEPEEGLLYEYNEHTKKLLNRLKVPEKYKQALSKIFIENKTLSENQFKKIIRENIPALYASPNVLRSVSDWFALAYFYKTEILKILVSDDAREYELIALIRMLCWIHDARFYKKLRPVFDHHRKILNEFHTRYLEYYRRLLDYKENPCTQSKQALWNDFDKLFSPTTEYNDLNKEISRTLANKDKLLTVLEYPFLPLLNNTSELAARRQARKRDISLHTMTELGTKLQDAFLSITQTCQQMNVDIWQYIQSRISHTEEFYLPDLVRVKINSS